MKTLPTIPPEECECCRGITRRSFFESHSRRRRCRRRRQPVFSRGPFACRKGRGQKGECRNAGGRALQEPEGRAEKIGLLPVRSSARSEERRVGKECRS